MERVGKVMRVPLIYTERNVNAHILPQEDFAIVHCYDNRDDELEIEVVIDLLTLLPVGYGDGRHDLPSPAFFIKAMQSVLAHHEQLSREWRRIQQEF